ncbi:MAG: TraR/DksA family transcriptional regulator [Elusimicrobia bacterium]|nr:TraR/DksA family transcriptional regulator [Elusimicrobiota bacterium]
MNKRDMAKFEKILIRKKTEILNKINAEKIEDTSGDIGDEIDSASQNSQKEMYFELVAAERHTLEAIDTALTAIKRGTYGMCQCCGKAIPVARLDAIPWVRYCKACQEEAEKAN